VFGRSEPKEKVLSPSTPPPAPLPVQEKKGESKAERLENASDMDLMDPLAAHEIQKGQQLLGFVKGVVKTGVETAKGLGHAIAHPIQTAKEIGHAVSHPVETAKGVGRTVSDAVENVKTPEDAGELAGRVVGEATLVVAPMAKVGHAGKVGRVGEVAHVMSGTGKVLPMHTVRTIAKGESLAELINEAKALTFTTGNEHAVVTFQNGTRGLVSGGPGGITFSTAGENGIKRILGHTHPTSAPPSRMDWKVLEKLGQSKQYVFHGGEITVVRPQ
jgi:hypothetical protein